VNLFFDPSRARLLDAAALAEFLGGLSDDRLRDVEEEFRLAAFGRSIQLRDDDAAVQFKGTSTVIPWLIADVVRSYRLHDTPLSNLELVAARFAEARTESDVADLEAVWQM